MKNMAKMVAPVHPGGLLREEFLEPIGMTAYQLAEDIGVLAPRMYDLGASPAIFEWGRIS
jgi:plasmid maintenance system antidote protein VapI